MTTMTANHEILLKIILMFSASVFATDIGLPMVQINSDEYDDYPELKEQVHLEDFFWTGSGDGPPDYVKKIHTGISKGKDVIVKTNTVVATVYVDGHNEVDIPICLDCLPDNNGGIPMNFSSTDRRYWLLTVISGFYTTKDIPMLEQKLARLYRLAFTRQQSKHLGIGNGLAANGASISASNVQPDTHDDITAKDIPDISEDLGDYHEIKRRRRRRKKRRRREVPTENFPKYQQSSSSSSSSSLSSPAPAQPPSTLFSSEMDESSEQVDDDHDPSNVTDITIEQPQLAYELLNSQNKNESKGHLLFQHSRPPVHEGVGGGKVENLPSGFNPQAVFTDDQIRIVIHNLTQITERDIQSGGLPTESRVDSNVGTEDINDKIDERPLANQTEIIYSVLVSGRPVLAVTAANDMKLVSELEVTSVLGKEIFMKAEPYLREPQATPLAPATRSSETGFIASLGENPLLILIGFIVILLLILLLVALLVMGKSGTRSKSEVKRASSRNELLAEAKSPRQEHQTRATASSIATSQHHVNITEGVQNFAYEKDATRIAIPPQHHEARSRRGSTSSGDNTSDSSVYCPINPPPPDVQRMLDEKAATLFDKRKRRQHKYDNAETQESAYTSVISERKRDKKHSSNTKHKTKRRYLSENRVGSIEEGPNHSSTETTASNESIVEALQPNYENLERTETFNPHNNYHRNKLLQNRVFTDKIYDSVPEEYPTQAINREIIKALQPSEKSSETGSIGSFLSMASVKSFPKHSLPEPLNRVLEPVFVTYYDNVDEVVPKPPRKSRPQSPLSEAVASIERFPEPKAPRSLRIASQSDNPDPGVVGPIVWEIHKKRMASENDDQDPNPIRLSPIRDPAETRNHFQGLLEGAIQMYSSQDDLPTPLPTKNFTNHRKRTSTEFRGRSAGSMDHPKSSTGGRPSTAQPEKTSVSNHSTQPPSPNMGAWGSGGIHQPMVRPLSAGPFHRPDPPPSIDVTRVLASQSANREDLSAAPLIEAIQNELRKFKRDT